MIFVGFSEALAAARTVASRHGYEVEPNQEMVTKGAANGLSGLVGGFVVTGSLSKTSVADAAGQRSQVASLADATLILATVVLLAKVFENLPTAALAAVVIDAMLGLVAFAPMRRYYRSYRRDFVVFISAMVGIFCFGIIQGIVIGVVLSLLLLIARASNPAIVQLGRDPKLNTWLDVNRHDGLLTEPDLLCVRIDGPLFFADANPFRQSMLRMLDGSPQGVRTLVLDVEAVSQTDTDGADILIQLVGELRAKEVGLYLARPRSSVLEVWSRAGRRRRHRSRPHRRHHPRGSGPLPR